MAIQLSSLRTPGVYVDEVSVLPPSVAAVETAIPVFIGHTQFAKDAFLNDVATWPAAPFVRRITSMLEFEQYFGVAPAQGLTVTVANNVPATVALTAPLKHNLYYAMLHYFANGGGPCHIASVANTATDPSSAAYLRGVAAINDLDEPTLIVFPDAVNLAQAGDYHDVLVEALNQCNIRGDRFLICDIYNGDKEQNKDVYLSSFRDGIGANHLKYAAAYYPWLRTSLNYSYSDQTITFIQAGGILDAKKLVHIRAKLDADTERKKASDARDLAKAAATSIPEAKDFGLRAARAAVQAATIVVNAAATEGPVPANATTALADANAALVAAQSAANKAASGTAADNAVTAAGAAVAAAVVADVDLAALRGFFTAKFDAQLKQLLNEQRVVLPPSAAVAGIYCMVDNSRGVWKAPANVSLARVLQPMVNINDESQRNLNVDDLSGKSINAIRTFTGKGHLVWGARTLDAFSDEWRYVNVRRLFNMVEESLRKASGQFVFEPNDANLWVKVKAMCENFLNLLWRQGALFGSVPAEAFRVKVGLGETMDETDINNGRLIISIEMAPVRPAEFIVLRFMHKMQTA